MLSVASRTLALFPFGGGGMLGSGGVLFGGCALGSWWGSHCVEGLSGSGTPPGRGPCDVGV